MGVKGEGLKIMALPVEKQMILSDKTRQFQLVPGPLNSPTMLLILETSETETMTHWLRALVALAESLRSVSSRQKMA